MSRNKRVVFKLYSADCLSLTARALTFRFVTRKIFNLVVFVTRKIFNYLHLKALLICHGLENNETRMTRMLKEMKTPIVYGCTVGNPNNTLAQLYLNCRAPLFSLL